MTEQIVSVETATRQPRRLPLTVLYIASVISATGSVMTFIAIPWFVLQTTGSAAQVGITGFFTTLPAVIAGLFGGVIIDRLGYKRTSVIADISSGIAVALVPLLHTSGTFAFWQLLALMFFGHLLDAPGATARYSMVPELAEMAGVPLERASAFNDAVNRTCRMLGAPLAALLITAIGPSNVLWIDAATFFISAVLIGWAVPKITAHQRSAEAPEPVGEESPALSYTQRYVEELKVGWRFIQQTPVMYVLMFGVMVTNFVDAAMGSVVQPYYAEKIFQSTVPLGILIAGLSGSALVGTLLMSVYGNRIPRRPFLLGGFLIVGLRYFLWASTPPFIVLFISQIICGLAISPVNPIMSTIQYEQIPQTMRARVIGTFTAGVYVAMPLGVLLCGYMLEAFRLQWTLVALGICYVTTALWMMADPSLKHITTQTTTATT
jgi:predicted MFS family arabinose efflux permease